MPFINEHAARLKDPDDFKEQPDWAEKGQKFARKADGTIYGSIKVPATVDVIWGQLKAQNGKAAAPQTLRFPTTDWTAKAAKKWLSDNNVKYVSFEAAKPEARASGVGETLVCSAPVELLAADAAAGEPEKPPRFSITAYTGGLMRVSSWADPVVLDLKGMELPKGAVPVLKNHDDNQIVGHADAEVTARMLKLQGVVSGAGEAAREVVESAKKGFPWRASVGARAVATEYVSAGVKVEVNGMGFAGPLSVVRRSQLGEVSFVPMGADRSATATVAARSPDEGDMTMTFEKWLEAKGFKADELSEEQKSTLMAAWKAESDPPADAVKTVAAQPAALVDPVADVRAANVAEQKRILGITKACTSFTGKVDAVKLAEIQVKAIEEGWDEMHAENELLKAQMPKPPKAMASRDAGIGPKVLEAAVRLGGVEANAVVEKAYPADVLERAYPLRGIGIKQLIALSCELGGKSAPSASAPVERFIEAAFSTAELTNLLGAVANKVAMQSYQAVPPAAARLAVKLTANNFQTHTGVKMSGITRFDEVGADGELKHFTLNEQTFSYKVDTYGRILALTRQQILNDDLNAFTQIPQAFGLAAARTLEHIFFTLLLANTGTYFTGANLITTALGSTGLSNAVTKLLKQTGPDGSAIGVGGKYLLVPPEVLATAQALYKSQNLVGGTSAIPEANIHQGTYEPVVSALMSNATYTGYSLTAWYLFADPNVLAAFGIAYLRGNEVPTFEPASLPGDVLGQGWRGFWDIGVCQVDPRGAVMSTGVG